MIIVNVYRRSLGFSVIFSVKWLWGLNIWFLLPVNIGCRAGVIHEGDWLLWHGISHTLQMLLPFGISEARNTTCLPGGRRLTQEGADVWNDCLFRTSAFIQSLCPLSQSRGLFIKKSNVIDFSEGFKWIFKMLHENLNLRGDRCCLILCSV
jgi:hypothetical protein